MGGGGLEAQVSHMERFRSVFSSLGNERPFLLLHFLSAVQSPGNSFVSLTAIVDPCLTVASTLLRINVLFFASNFSFLFDKKGVNFQVIAFIYYF